MVKPSVISLNQHLGFLGESLEVARAADRIVDGLTLKNRSVGRFLACVSANAGALSPLAEQGFPIS